MALYLVTGGAGFIGSHIVEQLVAHGEGVRVLDNFSTGKRANIHHLPVEIVEGDVRDRDAVYVAVRDADFVIHQAALVSVPQSMQNPVATHEINVNGTLNVLLAAHEAQTKRVVLASSCAVYGDNDALPLGENAGTCPKSPYAASKLIGEVYCQVFTQAYSLPTVCLRYFNVYGPRQNPNGDYAAVIPKFAESIATRQAPIIYGDGQQTRDFVHVYDVVRANLMACECEPAIGQIFNVATGRGVSLLQLVDEINETQGTSFAPEFRPPRVGDIKHSCGDGSKATQLLQFAPVISLRQGLQTILS